MGWTWNWKTGSDYDDYDDYDDHNHDHDHDHDWIGLDWIGLVWFGLVWFGLDWILGDNMGISVIVFISCNSLIELSVLNCFIS